MDQRATEALSGYAHVRAAAEKMREAMAMLQRGPLDFYLLELAAAHDLLMTRFAPFKLGDRVALAKVPDFEQAWGWKHCAHFLVEGAEGEVIEAYCGQKGFRFGVMFDRETWIDRDEIEQPVSQKHSFNFGEKSLRLLARSVKT